MPWDTKHHQAPGTFVKQFNEETRNPCSLAFASGKFDLSHLKNTEGLCIQPHTDKGEDDCGVLPPFQQHLPLWEVRMDGLIDNYLLFKNSSV